MIKRILHAVAWRIEKLIDRVALRRNRRAVIDPYMGYATPEHLVVRGRVLTDLRRTNAKKGQSRWASFRQMVSLFATDEVAHVPVKAQGLTAQADEEGYFTLLMPRGPQKGWTNVAVGIDGQDGTTHCPVLIPPLEAECAVISDIDDTMLVTGAYQLWRNLWTSMTGSVLTRRVYPDAVRFIRAISEDGRNPIYYVSSSPWNLHGFIAAIFDRAGLPRGPKFLRDLGVSETQFITGTHGDHKGSSIDVLLNANPGLLYILVGDTGQHDAFVYRDAVERHKGRIGAVVLRTPGPGPDDKSLAAMKEIEAKGIPVLSGKTFDGFAEQLERSGPGPAALRG